MPVIKVENKSDDDIIITLDGKDAEIANGEDAFFENMQKGNHSLKIHRKRVPRETVDSSSAPKGLEAITTADEKPGSHIQLDSTINFEVISSKAVITVIQDINGVETLHEDAVFVGYKAEVSGAKLLSKNDRFASEKIKKAYLSQQLKGAIWPVGTVGTFIMLLGAVLLFFILNGASVKISGRQISLPYAALITTGGVLVFSFFIVTVCKIKKRVKELWS